MTSKEDTLNRMTFMINRFVNVLSKLLLTLFITLSSLIVCLDVQPEESKEQKSGEINNKIARDVEKALRLDGSVAPELIYLFDQTSDKDQKQLIALGLVKLGLNDNKYFEYLNNLAKIAVQSQVPYPRIYDSSGKAISNPDFDAWCQKTKSMLQKQQTAHYMTCQEILRDWVRLGIHVHMKLSYKALNHLT